MVAALACGEEARYNVFVAKFQKQLIAEGKSLREFFSRAYGKNATNKLNEFVTAMANRESNQSIHDRNAYCLRAAELFDGLGSIRPEGLGELVGSMPYADNHGFAVCVRRTAAVPATPATETAAKPVR
jgi:hypothetical protein